MDENLKIDKKDVLAMKVEVINQPIEKKEDDTAPEYFEIKISDEDIEKSEEE